METKDEVVAYYDSMAEQYDESRFGNSYGRFVDAQERRVLDRLIDWQKDWMRLDLACGTGRLTNYATHGLDASGEMMRLAWQRHPNVQFKEASACATGFEDRTFDVVYSFHLLMHLNVDTIREIFGEVHRILKPGGRFIFDIPSKKRRRLLGHQQASWHGNTAMTSGEVGEMAGEKFSLRRRFGVMLLPVHKLPVAMRKPLQGADYGLANGWLKEYSSYLILELVKQ